MPETKDLDLILETRLDVLAQAIEEVNCVLNAMAVQNKCLTEVGEFLADAGALRRAEDNLLQLIGDAKNRVDVLLRSSASSAPAVTRLGGPPRPSSLSQADLDRQRRLQEVQEYVTNVTKEIDSLAKSRREAYGSFQDVWRWSVAGLAGPALREAVEDYQHLIRQIRTADSPWRRYQSEMPRLGHELFSRYLELLAGMAVRGFGVDPAVKSDADALIELLKGPEGAPAEPLRSPLALMSSLGRHIPLGYPEWSLWALPLVGRAVGDRVVKSLLPRELDKRLHVICADLYAQYVLGPSYLHAAIFLEFDPSPDPPAPNVPPDPLRAAVLLWNLRGYGADDSETSELIEKIVAPVEREWGRARAAVGGQEQELELDGEEREVVGDFLENLKKEFPEIAYPIDNLGDLGDDGRELTKPGQGEDDGKMPPMQLRDLMSAMWLARLKDPSQARLIHQRAKTVPRHGQGPSPTRSGLGAQPWSGTWA
jgi:hypothetical protein